MKEQKNSIPETQRKWKRCTGQSTQTNGEGVEVGTKRKEDLMDVDIVFSGDVNKSKNTSESSTIAMAKTVEQSRPSS